MAADRPRPYSHRVFTPALPPDPSLLSETREAAEQEGNDGALLQARELEIAHAALPPVIDGARRARLLHVDPIATTWEAWSTTGGQRLYLRCLRPRWQDDPVMRRRMAQAIGETGLSSSPLSWHPEGDWPHLRALAEGALVVDRFPVEDAPITSRMARLLGGGLRALSQLHAHGLTIGGDIAPFLLEQPSGASLVWMDVFGSQGEPSTDIVSLAVLIAELDPYGLDPVAELARQWTTAPPPTAADGVAILTRHLGTQLLGARHRLSLAGRRVHQQDRATRLGSIVRRLSSALPPPQGDFCLKSTSDGVLVLAQSDGSTVRGGAAADESGRFLPVIYTPEQGLDAQAARFLLRAWATRKSADPLARQVVQATLPGDDAQAQFLMRWLSCMARLRSARLLAAHRASA